MLSTDFQPFGFSTMRPHSLRGTTSAGLSEIHATIDGTLTLNGRTATVLDFSAAHDMADAPGTRQARPSRP